MKALRAETAKMCALATLGAVSLLSPLLEIAVTGRSEPLGGFALADTIVSLAAIYWWYYADKEQRQFRAGPLLNVGVIALAIIALPVYFIRSRGWKRGGLATGVAAAFLAATFGLEWLGETIGTAIAS
ncbi:MAG TPA: hypothetical protein VEH03_06025 [Burkholderiales bacterium]|nr:hypothetical protein [Burkholderiales bacterium]